MHHCRRILFGTRNLNGRNRIRPKTIKEDSGAENEGQATGDGAQREQPMLQLLNSDGEIDAFIKDKVIKKPLNDDQLPEVRRFWGMMIFDQGFTPVDKLYFVNRLATSVHGQDRQHPTEGLLKEAAAALEPSCVISLWMKKGFSFEDKEIQGPEGGPIWVKDDSVECKRCKTLCVRVEKVVVPGGVDKFRVFKRRRI